MPRIVPAAFVLLALALSPAAAQATHQHDLQFDKQEIFAEVPSGGAVTTLRASCSSGYRVIQGSVRVDTAPGGLLTNVRIRTSTPDNDPAKWFYELINTTRSGNQAAQVKLMISCVKPTTSGGSGNQHTITFADRFDDALPVAAARQFGSGLNLPCEGNAAAASGGYIPAGAGWVFDPDAGYRQLISVAPTVAQASGGSGYVLGDSQDFGLGGNTAQVAYTLYANVACLNHLTTAATGEGRSHQHYLDASVQFVNKQLQFSGSYYEQGVSCPSGYYAIAPTWSISEASNANGLRLVGIGYQGDQDRFRFVNPNRDTGFVSFGVICVGTKTSSTNTATPGAGPGPQSLLMSERSLNTSIGAGQTLSRSVGCAGKTDIVTAGGLGGPDAGDLRVVTSGGGTRATRWPFVLRNTSSKRARVRLYVKCLSPWAEGHTLVLDGLPAQAPDGVKSCAAGQIPIRPSTEGSLTADARYTCLERLTTQRINHVHRLHVKTLAKTVPADFVKTFSCPRHYQAVAGGVTGARHGTLVTSIPFGRQWTFGIRGRSTRVSVTCLKESTTSEVPEPLVQQVVAPAAS
ncbi:MAG: hypothetical protein ACJ762_00310 [Solirubrobacteraceae bacterium]